MKENESMNGLWTIETHAHSAEVSLCAKLRGADRGHIARRAAADHGHIIYLWHFFAPS